MIAIKKGPEPQSLKELRDWTISEGYTPEMAYEALQNPLKKTVREQLTQEQGHLCAYCMCQIPRNDLDPNVAPIIIEHYIPRNPVDGRDVGQGLDYNNMLAVCNGNRATQMKRHNDDLTCDAHRKNIEFKKVNPCNPSTLETIFYTLKGTIGAKDPEIQSDLVDTLNLNCPTSPLIAERKGALDGLLYDMQKVQDDALLNYCTSRLKALEAETDPKTPYVGILIWYLKDMIKALSEV